MDTKKIVSIVMIVVSVVLTVLAAVFLPQSVITQFGTGSDVTRMPKVTAVGIPALISIGGAVAAFIKKENDGSTKNSPLIISAVGIAVFIIMLIVNL